MLWGASLVMLTSGSGMWWWHHHTTPRRMEAALEPYAQLLGASLPALVTLRATNQITELLGALRAAPPVLEATVTDPEGQLLAVYRQDVQAPPRPLCSATEGIYLANGEVELIRAIRVDGQEVGRLHLHSRPLLLDREARGYALSLVGMGALLLGLTYWQTRQVRRAVARPVEALTAKVDHIIGQLGLQPDAETAPKDELERLDAHFEQMRLALDRHQSALQKTNEFLQAVLDNAAHPIISVDAQGTITSFNPAAERLLGYPAAEVVGRRTPLLFHDPAELKQRAEELTTLTGQPVPATMEVFWCLPRRGQTDEREWTYLCRDGRRVPVWLCVSALHDAQGRLRGYVGLAEDLTQRKAQELELRRKNEEMERFIYTVSHDLKSPLVTIKGFAGELLRALEERRYEHLAEDLQRVMAATDKMSELLNDLLELSRVGRVLYPPTEVPLAQVAREALNLLESPVREKRVEVLIQPDLPVVQGDRRRLFEVYLNLLENAVKFMGPQLRPRILVGWQSHNGEPVFFVEDNGIGVPRPYQETIFGLFNKLDQDSPGTGLGLAIVRRIIEMHGGRIWVESEGRGHGSRFCFTLGPKALSLPPQPASSTAMCDESASTPHPVGGG
ncbi:MAG: PAS domain S-box protein [Verrucomicrobiae bacterium]|nr:PAS domain S-box protein [Verrucomicrobiae bacterium]